MALWRKKPRTGGHYVSRGVRMAEGATIEATREQLGNAVDKFELLTPDPEPEPERPELALRAVHRGFGHWDVIHPVTGQAINDQRLSKEEALRLAGLSPDKDGD